MQTKKHLRAILSRGESTLTYVILTINLHGAAIEFTRLFARRPHFIDSKERNYHSYLG